MTTRHLSSFTYVFDKGAVPKIVLAEPLKEGNCRLAVQEFFFLRDGAYFPEDDLLNPRMYLQTGECVDSGQSDFFDNLPSGSVIFAEKIRNRRGEPVDRSPEAFGAHDDYLIALHSAVLIRQADGMLLPEAARVSDGRPVIWHATAIEGMSCAWSIERFLYHYKPITAKRFV